MRFATRALITYVLCAAPAAATELVVPVITNAAGVALPTRISVWLVDANGEQAIGTTSTGLATEYTGRPITEDLTLTLAPTGSISLPGGGPAFYRVRAAAGRARLDQIIELPDSATPLNLTDLVPDGSVWARQIIAARLLPATAVDGALLVYDASANGGAGGWVARTDVSVTPTPDPGVIDGGAPDSTMVATLDGGAPDSTFSDSADGGTP